MSGEDEVREEEAADEAPRSDLADSDIKPHAEAGAEEAAGAPDVEPLEPEQSAEPAAAAEHDPWSRTGEMPEAAPEATETPPEPVAEAEPDVWATAAEAEETSTPAESEADIWARAAEPEDDAPAPTGPAATVFAPRLPVSPEPEAPAAGGPAATIFVPRTPAPDAEPPAADHTGPAETVFIPSAGKSEAAVSPDALDVFARAAEQSAYASPPPTPQPTTGPQVQPGATTFNVGRVEIGTILNDNYQIKRLISRGGMGEVYEGFNLHNERDRVAIKVMLPALAADPNVMSMFMKEAGILSGIEHPGVVGYRGISKDQKLNVFYMVMGFIDGIPLGDMLARLKPTSADLRALTRRLAEGLRAAHEVGAIHRDISPDNVLLPGGRLEAAKIIDFGIAKDLDTSKATIIGDGFAGKLGYVAPEQMGAFDRQVGPWTDIYSLGLVILTAAAGKNIDMGATLMDAVAKRSSVPDLTPAPVDLRPILERMLEPDPSRRFRSMNDLLAALDGAPLGPTGGGGAGGGSGGGRGRTQGGGSGAKSRLPLYIGGGVAVALVLVVGLMLLLTSLGKPKGDQTGTATSPSSTGAPRAESVRRGIAATLPTIPCSWVDIDRVTDAPGGAGEEIKLSGVAGATSSVNAAITKAVAAAKAQTADLDMSDVAQIGQPVCSALDAFAPFRADTSAGDRRLSTAQTKYTMAKNDQNILEAKPVIEVRIGDPSLDFAFIGIQELADPKDAAGTMGVIVASRQELAAFLKNPAAQGQLSDEGGDSYRLTPLTTNAGWSGMILLTGKGPFDRSLLEVEPSKRDAAWQAKIKAAAQAGGWKAEMVWYEAVPPAG